MRVSLLDAIFRSITPDLVSRLSARFGEPEAAIGKGLGLAVPAVLAGLMTRSDDDLNGRLQALASDPAIAPLAAKDIDRVLDRGSQAAGAVASPFDGVLPLISKRLPPGLADTLASYAGLKTSTAISLLAMAGPLVLGQLGRLVKDEHLDSVGLGRRLEAERAPVLAALPPSLAGLLRLAPPTMSGAAATTATAVTDRAAAGLAATSSMTPLRWLGVGAAALLALWAFMVMTRGSEPQSAQLTSAPGAVGTSGYLTRTLPGGVAINVPPTGTEAKLLAFIESDTPADREEWFEFNRLNFDTSSATLSPGSREQLGRVADILKAYPSVRVRIGGYTDNSGDAEANRELSAARASTVQTELRAMGVGADRLEAEGYGEQHPIADNGTSDGRARNRRVALRVTSR